MKQKPIFVRIQQIEEVFVNLITEGDLGEIVRDFCSSADNSATLQLQQLAPKLAGEIKNVRWTKTGKADKQEKLKN